MVRRTMSLFQNFSLSGFKDFIVMFFNNKEEEKVCKSAEREDAHVFE